jgi:type II secretory ATPase GspE/PulE/Tfp pilus assembly ATPase PilB-like protein
MEVQTKPSEDSAAPAHAELVRRVISQIQSARDLDQLFIDLNRDILKIFDAHQVVLYAVDPEKNELLTRFPMDTIQIVRVPINEKSLAGYAAKLLRPISVKDVYNQAELTSVHPGIVHDASWDRKTGFGTKQVLTFPIVSENKILQGLIQLLNKKTGDAFTQADQTAVGEIAAHVGNALFKLRKQPKKYSTILDYFTNNPLLASPESDTFLNQARLKPIEIEALLIDKYKVPKSNVSKAFAEFYQAPAIEYDERLFIDPGLFKNLKADYLKRNFWVPLRRDKDGVEILVDNPNDLDKIQNIKRMFPGDAVRFAVGLRRDILQFIQAANEGAAGKGKIEELLGELASEAQGELEDPTIAGVAENDSAIVRLVNQIIADGVRVGASDIHVEPYGDKRETLIRFRVDGSCSEYMKLPASYRRAIVSRLKIMSSLDIAERRKPQDGKIKLKFQDNREIELRVATIPTSGRNNEDVVMRILTSNEPMPLERMEFSERNLRELKAIVEKPYGIILCVGPTGSGKTTTLHAVLAHINRPDKKIWTAEDPVEISQYGLRQVQVHPKIGFTFAAAMRSFLRADPDVIMVGEMRDKETADIGIEASLTGHLVFSTLHTNSSVETVTRLLDIGCDPFSFADAMLGVMAQRLAKRLCKECKEEYSPTQDEYEDLLNGAGIEFWEQLGIRNDSSFTLFRAKGCGTCNNTGFKGRVAVHELLLGSPRVKRLIQASGKTDEIFSVAVKEGMTTLVQDGIAKVLQGVTTYQQIKAVAIK